MLLASFPIECWPRSFICQPSEMARDLAAAAQEWRAAKEAVEDAKQAVKTNQDRVRTARADLADSLVAEAKRGTRMRDMVAATGLSREWIRTVLRQNGVLAED